MAKVKKQEEQEEGVEGGTTVESSSDVKEVTVVIRKSTIAGPATGFKRTFSESVHGEDFMKAAQAYADRFGGEII